METLHAAIYAVAEADRPVSIRHIFYRMVTQNLVEKSNKGYHPDSPPKIVGMAFVGLQQVWGVNRGVDRALRGVSERIGNG